MEEISVLLEDIPEGWGRRLTGKEIELLKAHSVIVKPGHAVLRKTAKDADIGILFFPCKAGGLKPTEYVLRRIK